MKYCYKIALINYLFDASYDNVRYFDTDAARDAYFDAKITSWQSLGVNFNAGDLFETVQNIRVPEYGNLINLLSKNYAVVQRQTCDDDYRNPVDDNTAPRLYYFVKRSTQRVGGSIDIQLELDVIMTFNNSTNAYGVIERAHLERFINPPAIAEKSKIFNNAPTSPLFEREQFRNLPQRLISRTRIKWQTIGGSDSAAFNDFLYENVLAWVYVYLSHSDYSYINKGQTEKSEFYFNTYLTAEDVFGAAIVQPYAIVAYPIYNANTTKRIYVKPEGKEQYLIDAEGFNEFEKLNRNDGFTGKVLNIKISPFPPFNVGEYTKGDAAGSFNVDTSGNLILNAFDTTNSPHVWTKETAGVQSTATLGILGFFGQYLVHPHTAVVKTNFKQGVFLPELKAATKESDDFNPKKITSDFYTVRITDGVNNYDVDALKVYTTYTYGQKRIEDYNLILNAYEPFTPDITRHYIYIQGSNDNGVFTPDTEKNFTGLIASQDLSMPYSKNNLDIYLASNKNFYLQRDISLGQKAGHAAINRGAGFFGSLFGGDIGGAFKNLFGAATDAADMAIERAQSDLTLDNMRNSPEVVQNANGSIALMTAVTNCQIYLEEYAALPAEYAIAQDYMQKNGFKYGRNGKVRDFQNIRKKYNYVQAIINYLEGDVPERVHDKIKEVYARGVRFWNTDDVNFDANNYERSIDNE